MFIGLLIFFFSKVLYAASTAYVPISLSYNYSYDDSNSQSTLLKIFVTHDSTALSNAEIIIESAKEKKLYSYSKTNEQGFFELKVKKQDLEQGLNITVYKKNYSVLSIVENRANEVHVELLAFSPETYEIIEGTLNGFDPAQSNAQAQVGIVAKALSIDELGKLDASSFLSPINDQINVYGKRDVPSNLVFPPQWFWFSLIPVYVEKPKFRLPIRSQSREKFLSLSGLVNVQKVVKYLDSNEPSKILDYLDVTRVGISDWVDSSQKQLNFESNIVLDGVKELYWQDNLISKDLNHFIGALLEIKNQCDFYNHNFFIHQYCNYTKHFIPTTVRAFTQNLKGQKTYLRVPKQFLDSIKILDLIANKNGNHYRAERLDYNIQVIPNSSLKAEVSTDQNYEKVFVLTNDDFNLMLTKWSEIKKTSLGSSRIEDHWIFIGPKQNTFNFPQYAYDVLKSELKNVNLVSVDLIKTQSGGYPYIQGDKIADGLQVVEKVVLNKK